MNRFLIKSGKEELFEEIWKSRETHLDKFPGFLKFNLLKGTIKDDVTLYASHTEWVSKSHFDNWIKSEAFKKLGSDDDAFLAAQGVRLQDAEKLKQDARENKYSVQHAFLLKRYNSEKK